MQHCIMSVVFFQKVIDDVIFRDNAFLFQEFFVFLPKQCHEPVTFVHTFHRLSNTKDGWIAEFIETFSIWIRLPAPIRI